MHTTRHLHHLAPTMPGTCGITGYTLYTLSGRRAQTGHWTKTVKEGGSTGVLATRGRKALTLFYCRS